MLTGHLPELLIVLISALVIFGPKRLPEIGASLGKGIRDFRASVSDLDAHGALRDPQELPGPRPTPPSVSDHKAG